MGVSKSAFISLQISFQAILATDGNLSFAIFNYERGNDIIRTKGLAAVIGFDAGDKVTKLVSRIDDDVGIFRIDGNCINTITLDSNMACGSDSVPFRCPMATKTYGPLICSCRSGISSNESNQCLEYLEHGEKVGDLVVPSPDIVSTRNTAIIEIAVPIVYYKKDRFILNVSTDGYISFSENFSTEFTSIPLPSPNMSPVIAPLWIMPPETDGLIINNFYYRVTNQSATLSEITALIVGSNQYLADFQPKTAVVVTLFLNSPDLNRGSRDQPNLRVTSVQFVLATDGNVSFAIFNYEGTLYTNYPHQIGFDAGDQERYTVINNVSDRTALQRSKLIYRIDGNCITTSSPESVCALNSVASECDGISATRCECNQGYKPLDDSTLTCTDVDECSENLHNCDHVCVNLNGSFNCDCWEGYQLQSDGVSCSDINECVDGIHRCDHLCINTNGTYSCACESGYMLQNDRVTCRDVDECSVGDFPCGENANCTNMPGNYSCDCNDGFDGDGILCEGVVDVSADNTLVIAIIPSVFATLVMVVVTLLVVLGLKYRLWILKRILRKSEGDGDTDSKENDYYFNFRRRLTVQSSFTSSIPKSLIVPSCNLKLGNSIGQGEFGIVYKAQIKSNFADTVSETVAVKTLKGFVEDELVNDLIKECARMHRFEHSNVLKLSGVCLDGGPAPYIIMPFMENGSLLKYLRDKRDSLVLTQSAIREEVESVGKRLMDMSIQVGKGMEYLASKRVVHRDLAARNCMIDINFVIKVADFGLSESIDTTKEYFRQDHDEIVKLPIKWLAPESINDGVFSEKSDVWSYGVTCWEIFNGGKTPYPGIHPADLPRQLDTGYRMEKPINAACSDDMYRLMLDCWKARAETRPSFAELVVVMTSHLVVVADYMDFSPTGVDPKKPELSNNNRRAP